MKTRLRKALQYWWYDRACRAIDETAPISVDDSELVVLSMLNTNHVTMYLVAAKTLHRQLGRGRFLVVDDGTLTDAQKARIRHHLPLVDIVPIRSIDRAGLPKGGTWERLALIAELTEHSYVVQMDADTLALRDIPEVARQIQTNASFTINGDPDSAIEPVAVSSLRMANDPSTHVQTLAERALTQIGLDAGARYVRGCSGFAGFARGSDVGPRVRDFSARMEQALGAKWTEWGSEQVGSNFVVANAPGAIVLSAPRYLNYPGGQVPPDTSFLHFIGPSRFSNGTYRRSAGLAIEALLRSEADGTSLRRVAA
ncbi:hypothetical protein [Roseiterribacter gracilis]|uniref:hypothetical protein n=1 Tax=Roseiterribacter gracilis TaxID=2812848 RepID=UPI003B43C581